MWDINIGPLCLLQAPERLQKQEVVCLLFYDSWKRTGSGVKALAASLGSPWYKRGMESVQDAGFLLASGCGKF